MKKTLRAITSAVLLTLPTIAAAQSLIPNNPLPGSIPGGASDRVSDLITTIIKLGLAVAGIIAVLFIIIGGFQYMTSGGNEELASRGKKTLQNAIIGLVVIILSYVIIVVIANALNGSV